MNAEQLAALRAALKLISQGRGMIDIITDELRNEGDDDNELLDEADSLQEHADAIAELVDQLEVLAR